MQQPVDIESGPIAARKEAWMVRPLHKSECHRFEYRGNNILFDVATGVFFHVDDVICDILDLCEGRSLLDLLNMLRDRHAEKEILSAFRELYGAAILSEIPPETRPFAPPGRLEIVHLGLDITYDGLSGADIVARDDGACPPAAYMEEEVACKAIDLLLKESGRIRRCTVTFQGGEPLLNAQLVEKVIDYALAQAGKLGKEIAFEVVSDSRLLNEQAFGLLRKRNADIVVKMDDPPGGEHVGVLVRQANTHFASQTRSAAHAPDHQRRSNRHGSLVHRWERREAGAAVMRTPFAGRGGALSRRFRGLRVSPAWPTRRSAPFTTVRAASRSMACVCRIKPAAGRPAAQWARRSRTVGTTRLTMLIRQVRALLWR